MTEPAPSAFVHAGADRTDHPKAPHRDGAPYAFTIRAAGGHPRRSDARVLRAASFRRRLHRLRGNLGIADGSRVAWSTRSVLGPTGRRMEEDHRRRPCEGRLHVRAAVAYGTLFARRDGGWPHAGFGFRRSILLGGCVARRFGAQRLDQALTASGPRYCRDSGHRRGLSQSRRAGEGCRFRRRRTACRQWLSARSVSSGRQQQAHRRLWWFHRKPLALPAGARRGDGVGVGRRSRRCADRAKRNMERDVGQQSAGAVFLR